MALADLMRNKHLANAQRLITHLGKVKLAFTISSLGFCTIHWLNYHGFSIYALSSAVVVGGMGATVASCLSYWLSRP